MDQQSRLDGIFWALADPTRRAVAAALARGPASISDLAAPHDMALPSFMKHIRVLQDNGLIRSEKRGRVRICTIRKKPFALARRWIDQQKIISHEPADGLDALAPQTIAENKDS